MGMAFAELGDAEGAWRIFQLMNPIHQADSPERLARYRVEPYVLAADIASVAPHCGRGGWTWYSGSAAWTWRLAIESILGLRLREGRLAIAPCLPPGWRSFNAQIQGAQGALNIIVEKITATETVWPRTTVNGQPLLEESVAFPRDGSTAEVRVWLY
jgi:cyclic beta-1,2-glucan synthetase